MKRPLSIAASLALLLTAFAVAGSVLSLIHI